MFTKGSVIRRDDAGVCGAEAGAGSWDVVMPTQRLRRAQVHAKAKKDATVARKHEDHFAEG